MKMPQKINYMFIILLISVILIWGIIIYQIINRLTDSDELPIEISNEMAVQVSDRRNSESINYNDLTYVKLDQDPFVFSYVQPTKKTKTTTSKKEILPKEFLQYHINGVVINANSKTILLQDQSIDQTIFLREGEVYKSIKIMKISPSLVEIKEHGKVKKIDLGD